MRLWAPRCRRPVWEKERGSYEEVERAVSGTGAVGAGRVRRARRGRGGGGGSAFRFFGGLCTGCGGGAGPLTDEEIQAAYFRAEEAYGWFSLETLPCGEKTQTIDGWLYYPVEYPGMENLADLRAYLRGLFSEELVDALLASGGAHPLYQDVDGALYVLPTSRERDESKGQADIQIKPYGQAGYSVIVEVDLLADGGSTVTGVESYAFPYEFLEDRWVFTDFHLIY